MYTDASRIAAIASVTEYFEVGATFFGSILSGVLSAFCLLRTLWN